MSILFLFYHALFHQEIKAPFPVSFGSNCQRRKHFLWLTLPMRRGNIANQAYWNHCLLHQRRVLILVGKGAKFFDLGTNVGNCFRMRLGNRPNLQEIFHSNMYLKASTGIKIFNFCWENWIDETMDYKMDM